MTRWTSTIVVVLASAGLFAAQHDEKQKHESVRTLASRDIAEKLDGKQTKATAVEVTLAPGEVEPVHRHPGPGFGYILEGEYEWAIDDQLVKVFKAGDTFYEPGGRLHRVGRNPGKVKTRLMAWVLHPRDAKQIAIPEPSK